MTRGESTAVRLARLDEVEVTVEKLVAGGDGLARVDDVPLLIPRSAPGDRLRVRVVERRPDFGRAEILEVLTAGPGRRQPPCPYFGRCGGCDLQHLDDERQTELRVAAASETLRRLGGLELAGVDTRVVRGEAWGYRLRTQLHIAGGRVGYFARGSHELVAVESCPILVPALEAMVERLARAPAGELPRRLDLAAGDAGRLSVAPVVAGLPQGQVTLTVGPFTLAYDARVFFQAHQSLLASLGEAVVAGDGGGTAYDLYAGVGLLALYLGHSFERVVAVEGNRLAARYARTNLRRNRLRHAEVVSRAVETWIDELPGDAERVVVDPPRGGLSRPVRRRLLERRPRHLTYVSCHPATLARDLASLRHRYLLKSVTYLDLFPQTGHLETVVQLVAA